MSKPYQILNFENDIAFYESFGEVPNYGDGDQIDFLHPVFDFIKEKVEADCHLNLKVTSARIIYTLEDQMGCEWHYDRENEFDAGSDYTLLLYCCSMIESNGGLLEFKQDQLCPQKGMGVFINNVASNSLHRATPMKENLPRKLFKLTFKNLATDY